MELNDTIASTGPFVSLSMPIEPELEDAEDRMQIRWGNARRELSEAGASEEHLDRIEPVVLGAARERAAGIHVVAPADGPILSHLTQDPDVVESARLSPVPSVVGILRAQGEEVSHLIVLADREGADIWVRAVQGETTAQEPDTAVSGDTEHIHKGHPGGWSQRRFQQRAENTWDRNAAGVASEVDDVARKVGAQVIVATGDERALGFLQEHLSTESTEILTVVDAGGRSDDDALERAAEEADRLVADVAARRTVDALERYGTAIGADVAADGPTETLRALSEGRVALLLVHDDPGDDRRGFSNVDGTVVAPDPSPLDGLGMEAVEGRLVDVAVRAAIATGAEVVTIPGHGRRVPNGGIGAVLRG